MRISSCYTSPTMATHLPSFSPPLKNSGSRVSLSPLISLRRLNLPWVLLLFFFLFNISITSSASSSSSSQISYGESCDSIVPGSNVTGKAISPYGFLQLQNGYYIGGDRILGGISQSSFFNIPKSLSFRTTNIDETITQGVFWVEGWLVFRGANMYASLGNSTLGRSLHGRFRPRGPRFPIRRGGASFGLKGFWSASTGKLCMVGSASSYSKEGKLLKLSAVFKLNYPENSTIFTSLITGSLESLDSADNLNYFEPISLLAFSQKNYNYTLISKENWTGFSGVDGGGKNASLSLPSSKSICSLLHRWTNLFELEYGSDCVAPKNCTPLGGSNGFLPGFMFFGGLQCSDDQRLRLWLGFSNTSYNGYNKPLVPNMTLVGEGAWDGEKNRLCIVACRIANLTGSLTEASVADCSIRLSLRFPATLSIRNRSSVVGQIWSNKTVNGSGDFDRIIFRGEDRMMWVQGLKYEYSVIDNLNNSCPKAVKNKGKRYPDGYSYDMKFDMAVKDHDGQRAWGYLTPLFVGDRFYDHYIYGDSTKENTAAQENTTNHNSLLNVSYKMSFNSPPGFKFGGNSSTAISSSLNTPIQISAEGIYDTETGGMCMVGCYSLGSHHQKSVTNDSMDCKILINVQFAPLDNKVGGRVKGTIKSMRENSDPLHFNSLELSSNAMYRNQAVNSVSRMDLEITMVLISNTLACIFIGLQLFYVKKHPDVLPFISLVMLVILTLGHMIPLLLNFEELFVANRTQQNVLLGSGGWVKVNEVIVRVVTMVAFLLQFRLLQLTWSSKLIDGSQKGLCAAEKKSLKVTLPLYLVGGLIAWFVHGRKNNKASMLAAHVFAGYQQHSIWEDLRSYAGLVLDGFLLPQILLNLFSNTKDKALAHSFYVGNTVVRLLPHAYDLYRTHNYVRSFDVSYFYASPGADFYSTAWDVIIPCGGLLFAVLIYFQQRFGGRCILPPRFREPTVYEKVPVVSSE